MHLETVLLARHLLKRQTVLHVMRTMPENVTEGQSTEGAAGEDASHSSYNRKTHGFRTFSHFGRHIWNNLPQDVRHSATLSSFESKLKTFLFSEYFS